ncbi:hypothetical protein G4Y79_22695 [Phototrophicus methaneseepsis]|uniref:DUF3349 domain-containing protein n=1 Tax=Phototrophicus methaneseepsis TaxID=2710758 RepID=A0A7S8E8T1_9CHLR|nr:hypothetical protein [Phototrophicus methaneseepsis]QPC82460.1 hypothetical protein G4Y79_22695 [Phototrophicus methaneseepsis]
MMPSKENMSEYFQRLLKVLQCAFTVPLWKEEYLPLIYYLYEETDLTEREVAFIVGQLISSNYMDVIHDVSEARTDFEPDENDMEELITRLEGCGFGAWAKDSIGYK